jgi:uncharacterized membrane protein YozB (DUF420 family)
LAAKSTGKVFIVSKPWKTRTDGAPTVTYLEVHELMAQANLIIQTIVLLLIVFAIVLAKKKKFVWHGNVMLVAVIITGLLLIMHMGPAFYNVVKEGVGSLDGVALFGMAHGILGTVALSLGLWLTVVWVYLESKVGFCAMNKKWMMRILALWIIALGFGYVYYVIHIVWS